MTVRKLRTQRAYRLTLLENVKLKDTPAKGKKAGVSYKTKWHVLYAVSTFIGDGKEWTLKIESIAERARVGERTARRALLALKDDGLLNITELKRWDGSRACSKYQIVWSNLDALLEEQGIQLTLDLDDRPAAESESESNSEPPGHEFDPTGHESGPPGHGGRTRPAMVADPPGHGGRAKKFTSPSLTAQNTSPSSSTSNDARWEEAEEVLKNFGMGDVHGAIRGAKKLGFTERQVCEIVAYASRHVIAGIQAWGHGAVYFRITKGSPRDAVTEGWPAPDEDYTRAKRNRELALKAKKAAEAEARRLNDSREFWNSLEFTIGPKLDALTDREVEKLAASRGEIFLRIFRAAGCDRRDPRVRPTLLKLLSERLEAGSITDRPADGKDSDQPAVANGDQEHG